MEPRPRSDAFLPSLAAHVRDPAWLLCRQWQTGELAGQDVGSPAFITVATSTSPMTSWTAGTRSGTIDPTAPPAPLEREIMAEPFSADDLSLSVEIGQTFRGLLAGRVADPAAVYAVFLAAYPLTVPDPIALDPRDAASAGFLTVCAGRALDGAAVYALGKQLPNNPPPQLPPVPAAMLEGTKAALGALVIWVQKVWGDLAEDDPAGWVPDRLEHQLQVQALAPDGAGVTFQAHPDSLGELPWSSFDVAATTAPPAGAQIATKRLTIIPSHVRFRSIASPRFWDFETSELSLPDVKPEATDVNKVLALDFMLIHGTDWMIASLPQALGTLTRVDGLVVTDVFGFRTGVDRADIGTTAPGPNRWTLFAPDAPAPILPSSVGNFFVCSPTAGAAARAGRVIEDVRFARDDMASMAWGIERATMNLVGMPRPGAERDAAVDELVPIEPGLSTDETSPLRYQIETKVPIHWIPLVGVRLFPQSTTDPSIILQKAFMLRPNPDGPGFVPVAATGRILKPVTVGDGTYQIVEEEVPRAGLVVERVVYRTRWIDGSTHLWIGRRRRTGAGETSSALRFDVALPTT